MDPDRSIVDFALVIVRLGRPFAARAEILGELGEEAWAAACSTWRARLASDPALRETFRRAYAHALTSSSALGTAAEPSPQRLPPSVELPDPDQTQLVPALVPTSAALPFEPGSFRPAPLPLPPRPALPDPDATQVPRPNAEPALPFFQRYPSRTGKP